MDNNLGRVVLVKDINLGFSKSYDNNSDYEPIYSINSSSSFPNSLIEFKDRLYFAANNGTSGQELFVSDGTAEGTRLVTELDPGAAYSPLSSFVEFKDRLYFAAGNGTSGQELFVSDGTAEGTQLVADIRSGDNRYSFEYSYGSYPDNLVEFNNKLYFTADDGKNGNELFVSDGTAEGTQLLVDLRPGNDSDGSSPDNLVEFKDKLYFMANNGENGNELCNRSFPPVKNEPTKLR